MQHNLLLVIEATNGLIVVESLEPYHHDGARYVAEAKKLGLDALPYFNPAGDYHALQSFKQGEANWHPVFSDWSYFTSVEQLTNAKPGFKVTPFRGHLLFKRLSDKLPLETRRKFSLTV